MRVSQCLREGLVKGGSTREHGGTRCGDETGQEQERAEDPDCEGDQQEFLPRGQPLFGILEPVGSVLNSLPRPLVRVSGRGGDPDPDAPAGTLIGRHKKERFLDINRRAVPRS